MLEHEYKRIADDYRKLFNRFSKETKALHNKQCVSYERRIAALEVQLASKDKVITDILEKAADLSSVRPNLFPSDVNDPNFLVAPPYKGTEMFTGVGNNMFNTLEMSDEQVY